MSMTKIAKHSLNDILRQPALTKGLIYGRCLSISQMAVKAVHLCDVLMSCRDEDAWPDFSKSSTFVQLFTQGCNSEEAIDPAIESVWRDYFEPIGYPVSERYPFDNHLVYHNAKLFQKGFLANIRRRFGYRQRKAIRAHLGKGATKRDVDVIRDVIRGNVRDYDRSKHFDFIEKHKKYLPQKLSTLDYLKYYKFLSNEYPFISALKLSRLFSKNYTQRRFIALDPVTCSGLFQHAKMLDENVKDMWLKYKIERNGWNFSECILTDGEHCHVKCLGNDDDIQFYDREFRRKKRIKLKISRMENELFEIRDEGNIKEYLQFYVKHFYFLWSKNAYTRYGAGKFQKMTPNQKIFI